MYNSIYDFKGFYNSTIGEVVRLILRRKIRDYWKDTKGYRVVGIGYTQPYLDLFLNEADNCIAINPAGMGSFLWPENAPNRSVLAEETELPIETNSVDRVLLVHSLEYAEMPKANMQEIFRILKSNGRLIVLTPNRRGLWSRAEWSPFGHGTPYSSEQIKLLLRENLFVYERSQTALFTFPLRWNIIQKSFEYFEAILPYILSSIGGVHIIEASKQVYSGTSVTADSKVVIRGRPATAPISMTIPADQ